jgi:hypothetical protein
MCQFYSAIITENKILDDINTDSHEDIITKYKLNDTTTKPDFVRIEVTGGELTNSNDENWKIRVDQDLLPKWWSVKKYTSRIMKRFKEYRAELIKIKGHHIIKNQRIWLFGEASAELHDNSSATLWDNSSAKLYDSSSAILHENSSAELYDNSSATFHENSSAKLYDSSSAKLYDSSSAVLCHNSSAVLWNSSSAELYDNSSATFYDNSSAVLWNSSSAELWGSSSAVLWNSSSAELWNSSSAEFHNGSSAKDYRSHFQHIVVKGTKVKRVPKGKRI